MKDKLLKIIQKYGIEHQQRKLEEEVFELQQAIINYEDVYEANQIYEGNDYNISKFREHIEEEISDVMVMLKQIQYFYDIKDEHIEEIMNYKIDRQLERIENE